MDRLTQAEQDTLNEDRVLKRACEIKKAKLARVKARKEAEKNVRAMLKATHYLKRCRECKAMKFYLKNGKKP